MYMQVTQRICGLLAFLIHLLLTFLIIKHSPKSLGAYRILLIYISLFELVYALIDVTVSPELFTVGASWMLIIDSSRTFLPFWSLYPILLLFCGMLGYSLAVFSINFVYRYLVLKGSTLVKSFDSPKLLIWIVTPLSYSAVWMFVTHLTLAGNQYTDKLLNQTFLIEAEIAFDNVIYIGPNYYPFPDFIDWIPIVGTFLLTVMIFLSIMSIVYFATKSYIIMNTLVATSKNSSRYRTQQAQLLNALVLQALIPFFLMHLPASFVFIMPFFEMGQQIFARIFSVTVALYPVLDPLPTIFVVKYYRKAMIYYTTRIFCSSAKPHRVADFTHNSTSRCQSATPKNVSPRPGIEPGSRM